MAAVCISVTVNIFRCLLAIGISLEKSLQILGSFLDWVICLFFSLNCKSSFYIQIQVLHQTHDLQIFPLIQSSPLPFWLYYFLFFCIFCALVIRTLLFPRDALFFTPENTINIGSHSANIV